MVRENAPSEVREVFERCRRRFPTIDLPSDVFLARIEEIGLSPGQIHSEDLFLALACARGDRIAWEYFADGYLPLIKRLASQASRQFQESEDLTQEIVATLIEEKGKLAGYNGRGSLASWLRVSVAHAAIDRYRRGRKQVSLEELAEQGRELESSNPAMEREQEALDAHWGAVLAGILREEIGLLPARDRLLLSLYYLHDVPLKKIGGRIGVHEATASRWLESIRHGIRRRVERQLRRQHRLKPQEIQSLWQWVSEQKDFSLEKALGSKF